MDAATTNRRIAAIGIDPGADGAVAALARDGDGPPCVVALFALRMTPLAFALREAVRDCGEDALAVVALERVHAMPQQGVSSTFAFGREYGRALGVIEALGLCELLRFVAPQRWRRAIRLSGAAKQAVVRWALRQWPGIDLRATPRCRSPHSGLADALGIAWWGLHAKV